MSLVAMKRKSRAMHNKISHNKGFSLNGTTRIPSSSWVGGSHSFNGSNTRVRFRGTEPVGHGGCCGKYTKTYSNSGKCNTVSNDVIKPTVKTTKGHHTVTHTSIKNGACNNIQILEDNADYESYYQKKVATTSCGNEVNYDAGICESSCKNNGRGKLPVNMAGIKRNTGVAAYTKTVDPLDQSTYIDTRLKLYTHINKACDKETELYTTNYVCKP